MKLKKKKKATRNDLRDLYTMGEWMENEGVRGAAGSTDYRMKCPSVIISCFIKMLIQYLI